MPAEQDNLQFLICQQCNGLGTVNNQTCSNCRSLGVIGYLDGYILFWGKKIDYYFLKLYKIERLINFVIYIILIAGALLGLLSLLYAFYLENFNYLVVFTFDYWFNYSNIYLFIFWLSIFFDLYLIYLNFLNKDEIKTVLVKKYISSQDSQPIAPPTINWVEVLTLKNKYKIDIAQCFTAESHLIVANAFKIANQYKALEVGPVHFLMSALINSAEIQNIFIRLGIDLSDFAKKISHAANKYPVSEGITVFSSESSKLLIKSYREAYLNRQEKVEPAEIVAEAIRADKLIQEVLFDYGLDLDKVNNVIVWFRIRKLLQSLWTRYRAGSKLKSKSGIDRAMTAVQTPYLNEFSEDLTFMAKMGYLNLCIGRDHEFENLFRILEGSSIKAAIIVGEAGTGKTAFIEGLAQKMIADDVPLFLRDKRLVSLSISRLVAGSSVSEVQEKLLIILNEIVNAGNVVLFIDNFHDLMTVAGGELAEVINEVLAKNLLMLIASTTIVNYSQDIENTSIGNIIKKVEFNEPDLNESIQIIEGKIGYIEGKNNVYFAYSAIEQAVKLTDRFIHESFLPYKAITLLEEVAVWARQNVGKNQLISGNDVATLLSEKIGMPVSEITESESQKLLNLEELIHQRMIDQEEAVAAVANSLRRARAELREIDRPIANLLFLGPTGVGKTELAKQMAAVYFGNEENMIRLDMSEYQEKESINRLIGAPPGYAGAGSGGYLTEAVRRNPFGIVLLDELEKAHPDILTLFLQVMEDGRLTDSTGRTIDFTNVILIATSNAGTSFIQEQVNQGTSLEEIKKQLLETELKQYFKPEFLNRFDNIIIFKPLNLDNVIQIAHLMLADVAKNLLAKGITFRASEDAIEELARAGYDPQFGARPLRRAVQEKVDNALAQFLLKGKIGRRDVAVLERGGTIRIEKAAEL